MSALFDFDRDRARRSISEPDGDLTKKVNPTR